MDNARVTGADRLEYDSGRRRALAVFEIAARSERKRELRADEGLSRRHEIAELSSRALRRFASSPKLASAQKPILERAAERLIEAEVREAVIPKRKAELVQVERDIVRLREDVRALGRSRASAAQRIAERLLAAEDRGRALRVRIAELRSEALERHEPKHVACRVQHTLSIWHT